MNAFDASLITYANGLAHRWPALDWAMRLATDTYLLRGEPFLAALWWFWFARGAGRRRRREIVVATLVSALLALAAGRLLAHALPFRVRPLFNPELALRFPFDQSVSRRTWSAFPSDHAMLFAAMTTGIAVLSRRAGVAALAYFTLVICASRLFRGLHHPTDLIAGALLGAGLAAIANRPPVRARIAGGLLRWCRRHPASFYALSMLLTIQLATLFEELRAIVKSFARALAGRSSVVSAPTATAALAGAIALASAAVLLSRRRRPPRCEQVTPRPDPAPPVAGRVE